MTIHWCGTGLSSIPGLRRLIMEGHDVIVWNRTIEKAKKAVGDITNNIYSFDIEAIEKKLSSLTKLLHHQMAKYYFMKLKREKIRFNKQVIRPLYGEILVFKIQN